MKKIFLIILISVISASIVGSFVLGRFETIEHSVLVNDLLSILDPKEIQADLLDFINWILYDDANNFVDLKLCYIVSESLMLGLLLILAVKKIEALHELISDCRNKFTKMISWIPPPLSMNLCF